MSDFKKVSAVKWGYKGHWGYNGQIFGKIFEGFG